MRAHSSVLGAAACAAMTIGLLCVALGTWIPVKAALAQVLIRSAWYRERAGLGHAQPWPWADTQPLARLTFGESMNSPGFVVLEGASGRNLAFGPVHDPASVRPGDVGNSVIEGHRDTHFAILKGAQVGDIVQVETLAGRWSRFQITEARVVDSRSARIVLAADHPRLTLVTCYPFDAVVPGGPLRWVVTADLAVEIPAPGSS